MKIATKIGLLSFVVMTILNQFVDVPFLSGVFAGLAVCFLMIGLLPQKKIESIKNWKRSIF
jgi:hypothetical protein